MAVTKNRWYITHNRQYYTLGGVLVLPLKKQPMGIPIVRGKQKKPKVFAEIRKILKLKDEQRD